MTLTVSAACDAPRDPEGTLERARGGTLRVGITEHRPWAFRSACGADEPQGIEAELVRGFARQLGARVEWTWGPEQQLFEALERFELDLAIGGFTKDTPWKQRLALTRAYFEHEHPVREQGKSKKRVLAVAPGENRTLLELDRYLFEQRAAVARQIGEAAR